MDDVELMKYYEIPGLFKKNERNDRYQLIGTDYYLYSETLHGRIFWAQIEFVQTRPKMGDEWEEYITVMPFQHIFDNVSEDIQTKLLFHLELFLT
jgi:hypothetical protein